MGAAAQSRAPVFVADVTKDPRYIPFVPGVRAELAIPLVHRDRLVGVLNIEGPDAEAFTEQARAALQVLAGHLAVAIENATLYRETRWYAAPAGHALRDRQGDGAPSSTSTSCSRAWRRW